MASTAKYNPPSEGLRADLLLVTATDVEAEATLNIFQAAAAHASDVHFIGNLTYFDFGAINRTGIVMVRGEMGAEGPAGATLTINEAIATLSPCAIVMVGIAFGLEPERQRIGDILISKQLLGYELQRIGSEDMEETITLRGDRPQAPPRILDRFHTGALSWSGQKVDFGLILSGDKLIDNIDYRDQLHRFAPDAIGGEMEGTGLYSAAQRHKIDWILVKAICDWADGNKNHNKDRYQKEAAENAARFVLHVVQQGGLRAEAMRTPEVHRQARQTQTVYTFDIHTSWVGSVDWEPGGNRIASAGGDGTVRVWDANDGTSLLTYRDHTRSFARVALPSPIYTIAWAPEGLRIASTGAGAQIRVWDATTGHTLTIYQGHSGMAPDVYTLAWSPDGTRIASACSVLAGADRTLHIWEVATGQTILRCRAPGGLLHDFSILAIAWSPDGTRIAAACGGKMVCIWNAANGQLIATYRDSAEYICDIAWSPDSTKIATANTDHTVQIWDTKTAAISFTYYGHKDRARDVAWSPDGRWIASASNDKTVRVWEPATGNLISPPYQGHSDWVTAVAWSPDGRRIASASNDKTVQVWHVQQTSKENVNG